jgi:hypothetical protein
MATLTWMLFVYAAAVLTPLAGVLAAVNLVRRWQRNRQYAQAVAEAGVPSEAGMPSEVAVPEEVASTDEPGTAVEPAATALEPGVESVAEPEPASLQHEQTRPSPLSRPVPKQPAARHQPAQNQPAQNRQPLQKHQPKSQPLKKPAQAKQRKKAA